MKGQESPVDQWFKDRAPQYFMRVMHGQTNMVCGPGATAHRFNVAMCEMARATQQHSLN